MPIHIERDSLGMVASDTNGELELGTMHMSVGLASLYFGSAPFPFFALYNRSALERANQKCQRACGLSPGKDCRRLRLFRTGATSRSRRSTASLNWPSSTTAAYMHSSGRAAASLAAGAMPRPDAGLALSPHIGASGRDHPRQMHSIGSRRIGLG